MRLSQKIKKIFLFGQFFSESKNQNHDDFHNGVHCKHDEGEHEEEENPNISEIAHQVDVVVGIFKHSIALSRIIAQLSQRVDCTSRLPS